MIHYHHCQQTQATAQMSKICVPMQVIKLSGQAQIVRPLGQARALIDQICSYDMYM